MIVFSVLCKKITIVFQQIYFFLFEKALDSLDYVPLPKGLVVISIWDNKSDSLVSGKFLVAWIISPLFPVCSYTKFGFLASEICVCYLFYLTLVSIFKINRNVKWRRKNFGYWIILQKYIIYFSSWVTVAVIWQLFVTTHMPQPTQEMLLNCTENYWKKWNLPHSVGAIDGSHIRIKCLSHSG